MRFARITTALLPAALALLGACSSNNVSNGNPSSTTGTTTGSGASSTGTSATSGSSASSGASTASGSGATSGSTSSTSGTVSSGVGVGAGAGSSAGVGSGSSADGGADAGSGAGADAGAGAGAGVDAGTPSMGCGTQTSQQTMAFVQYPITVTLPAGTNPKWATRDYYVWLPSGYDPSRAYTTVFLGPGCGGTGKDVVPVNLASKSNAILIGLDPDPDAEGRPCFNTEEPNTPEIPYFDQTLAQVEAKFCVDTSRIFIAGFSSGSWLADTLGCVRAGVIRGQGNAAGELQGGLTCSGQPIAAMMIHDTGDGSNDYQQDYTGARAAILMRNGCTTQTMPYDPGISTNGKDLMGKPIQCVEYQGCKPGYPLVWCPTTGYGHNDQTGSGLSTYGWWNFWEMLP